jgi:hypothetical protein
MYERRRSARIRILKEGRVLLNDQTALNCIVRDISAGGARLEFEGPVELPREFRLRIVSADLTIPARPIWQRRLEAGVTFTGVGQVGAVDNSPQRLVPAQ